MIFLENVFSVIERTFDSYDEVWFITRKPDEIAEFIASHSNAFVYPQLSPQQDLFMLYRSLDKAGLWNQEAFDKIYVPRFISDFSSNHEGVALLQLLKDASLDKRIALACFCSDERMCHRSIIGGFLMNLGARISCSEEYGKYDLRKAALYCTDKRD